MLTLELLRARVGAVNVTPRWLVRPGEPVPPAVLARAEAVLALYREHAGRPRSELRAALALLCAGSPEPRLERGFAKLVEDRASFAPHASAAPPEVRRVTFALAARARAEGRFEREAVLAGAASALGLASAEDVETSLWADLRASARLAEGPGLTALALVARYDVALAQAVLLRAEQVEVEVDLDAPGARALLRALKFRRVLFRARRTPGGLALVLDGPLSLFGPAARYGLRLAEVLPAILRTRRFSLVADLRWGRRRAPKRFTLSSEQGLRAPGRDPGAWAPPEVDALEKRFRATVEGWRVSSRGAPLVELGGEDVLVPDLRFVHEATGREVFLEVLGHWRRRTLERRLELLRKHAPADVIVAVARGLALDEEALARDLPVEVVLYREVPSVREIKARLERML